MSPTPALLCDRKQCVSQSSLWYRTSGVVSLYRQNLNRTQRKATVTCLLLCLHHCYIFRQPWHVPTHTQIHAQIHIHRHITAAMCDYKGTGNQAKMDISMLSLCYHLHANVHLENGTAAPAGLTYDGGVWHKFALCMCHTPNYSSGWRQPSLIWKKLSCMDFMLGAKSKPKLWLIKNWYPCLRKFSSDFLQFSVIQDINTLCRHYHGNESNNNIHSFGTLSYTGAGYLYNSALNQSFSFLMILAVVFTRL